MIYLIGFEHRYHVPGAVWAPTSDTNIDEYFGYYTSRELADEAVNEWNLERHGTITPSKDVETTPVAVVVPVERAE